MYDDVADDDGPSNQQSPSHAGALASDEFRDDNDDQRERQFETGHSDEAPLIDKPAGDRVAFDDRAVSETAATVVQHDERHCHVQSARQHEPADFGFKSQPSSSHVFAVLKPQPDRIDNPRHEPF